MKILKYIACSFLPLAIMSNNDTMALRSKVVINNQISNNNIDGVMKLYNGGAMCSLASLNQCISALNPGNNEILKQFIEQYNNIANNKNINKNSFQPNYILNNVLDYAPRDEYKKILLEKGGVDIDERYHSLIRISEMFGADISTVNNYTVISHGDEIHPVANTLREEIIRENKDLQRCGQPGANYNNVMNLVLQFDCLNIFNKYKNEIINANDIVIDNNSFSLSSVALRTISPEDAKLNNNMSQGDQKPYFANANGSNTHFISAKKLANGKWALVDSLPVSIKVYDSFKSLMNSLGNRYLPRMVFFSKTQNNNVNNNNNRLKNNNKNMKNEANKNKINKNNININEYNINNIKKNKQIENNNEQSSTNRKIKSRINNLKEDIAKVESTKHDSVDLLKACLREDRLDINHHLDIIRNLYRNKEMRELIIKNSNSDEVRDFLNSFKYIHLYKYIEIISDIFNKHARLKTLKTELSEIDN